MPATEATARRDGDALHFSGAVVRANVSALWRAAQPHAADTRLIDITGATRIDSAGLALLSALAGLAARGAPVDVTGTPPGLAELRAAYRLDTALGFAS